MTREEVEKSLKKAGYEVFRDQRLANESGDQLRLVSPQIVNVFDTGTVTVQGKPGRDLRELLSSSNEPATSPIPSEERYLRSRFYEQLVEHVFISELLQEAWFGFGEVIEVLRSEIDASGYDLVLECGGIVRHVQLKTSAAASKTSRQKVNVGLQAKPSGCVVWVVHEEDPARRRMRLSYRFFGAGPGEGLPSLDSFKVARHTKGDSSGVKHERPAIRVLPKREFRNVATTRELLGELFGLG